MSLSDTILSIMKDANSNSNSKTRFAKLVQADTGQEFVIMTEQQFEMLGFAPVLEGEQ